MARTFASNETIYRAVVKVEFFSLANDKPFTMQPGEYEYTEQFEMRGPYSTTAPAKRELKKLLEYKPMDKFEGREESDKENDSIRSFNANPPHWAKGYAPRELREWYRVVTDFGIDKVEPHMWERVQ